MILIVDHRSRFPEALPDSLLAPSCEPDLVKPLCSIRVHCNTERLWGANVCALRGRFINMLEMLTFLLNSNSLPPDSIEG